MGRSPRGRVPLRRQRRRARGCRARRRIRPKVCEGHRRGAKPRRTPTCHATSGRPRERPPPPPRPPQRRHAPAIRRHPTPSGAISSHQEPSATTRSHQQSSEAISNHQEPSEAIRSLRPRRRRQSPRARRQQRRPRPRRAWPRRAPPWAPATAPRVRRRMWRPAAASEAFGLLSGGRRVVGGYSAVARLMSQRILRRLPKGLRRLSEGGHRGSSSEALSQGYTERGIHSEG